MKIGILKRKYCSEKIRMGDHQGVLREDSEGLYLSCRGENVRVIAGDSVSIAHQGPKQGRVFTYELYEDKNHSINRGAKRISLSRLDEYRAWLEDQKEENPDLRNGLESALGKLVELFPELRD